MSIKILFVAANPLNTERLRLDEEIREIDEALNRAKARDKFVLQQKWAVRLRDLRRALLDFEPTIVHFSGHGAGEKGVVLEDDHGFATAVPSNALSELFSLFPSVTCVVLNACYTASQAEAIANSGKCVIGMSDSIEDRVAREFAVSFYDALGAEKPVEFAFALASVVFTTKSIPKELGAIMTGNCKETRTATSASGLHPQFDR